MRKIWIAALGSGFIAACGGGGDGGTATPNSIAITAANQDAVAGAAAGAVAAISGAGGGFSLPSGASAATATRAFAARVATAGRKQAAAAGRAGTNAVPPETVQCSVSGTATLSVVDADDDGTPSVGDRLSMSFDQCKETATDTIDGSMAVTLSEISFDSGRLSFTGSSTIDDLVVTEGTRSARMDGSLTMSYVETSASVRVRLVVGASGLDASTTVAGTTESIGYEPDFSYTETGTISSGTGELTSTSTVVQGGFSASTIGGRVQLDTPTAIQELVADAYPRAGVLRVTGQGSSLRLTALNATTVRVELDANQDGSYEATKDVAWSVLLPR